MKINFNKYKPFYVSDIFEIMNGKGITKEEIEDNPGDFTVVQSGSDNNGCIGKIDKQYCSDMNYTMSEVPCLTVARSGSAGYVSYQNEGCVVGDSAKILLLRDSRYINDNVMIFLQTILTANKFKYTYGRKVTADKYAQEIIMLPVIHNQDGTIYIDSTHKYSKEGYVPDWEFMDVYIKSLHYKPLKTKNKKAAVLKLNVDEWKEFCLSSLFEVSSTKTTPIDILDEYGNGEFGYITTSASDNGVSGYYNYSTEQGNVITIESACMGYSTYQENNFSASDHVEKLTANFFMNKYIALFIVTLLNKECDNYSYGRKCNQDRIKNRIIKLPIQFNLDGSPYIDSTYKYSKQGYVPDWELMEKYIKSLPYGDRL